MRLEANFLEGVDVSADWSGVRAVEAMDAGGSFVDDAKEFGSQFRIAVFAQALLGLVGGKPTRTAIRFLRAFETRDLAKMNGDSGLVFARLHGLAAKVARERNFFDAAMNASFFESFEGGRFGVCAARFDSTFGEDPASAAGLHQEKFEVAAADTVADGGDLLARWGSFRRP